MRCVFSIPGGFIERGIPRPVESPPWSTEYVILTTLLQCESKSSETSDDELDYPEEKGENLVGFVIHWPWYCSWEWLFPAVDLPG